jgi:hypothetical protein
VNVPRKRKLSQPKKFEKATYPTEALVAEVDLGSSNGNQSDQFNNNGGAQ